MQNKNMTLKQILAKFKEEKLQNTILFLKFIQEHPFVEDKAMLEAFGKEGFDIDILGDIALEGKYSTIHHQINKAGLKLINGR